METSRIERAAEICGVRRLDATSKHATQAEILSNKLSYFFRSEIGLSKFSTAFAMSWVKENAGEESCQRVMSYILDRVNGRRSRCRDAWQRGCPQIIPGLRASKFWDPDQFSWIKDLRKSFPKIREEVMSLRDSGKQKEKSGFQPYRAPSSSSSQETSSNTNESIRGSAAHDSGEWNIYYLYLHNMDFTTNRDRLPETVKVLKNIPRFYDHAMLSNLSPNTHVTKHHGPTNKKLRIHLPLYVPSKTDSCRLRVGDETRSSKEGHVVVFDDSFEHEAWNDSNEKSRVVLIFDIWHPDLSDREIKFLSFIQKAQLRAERKRVQYIAKDDDTNLFSIIESNRSIRPDQSVLWSM